MASKNEDKLLEVIWAKSIIYTLIIILLITFIILAPKKVFDSELPLRLATSMAITTDDNLLFYDYKVYGSETRFNDGLVYDVDEVKLAFLERNEVVAIKVYGDNNTIEVKDDAIFITNTETPELNIEYYLVKNMEFNNMNIPCRTFIMLFKDISTLVNNIYLAVFLVVSVSIFTPMSIKLTRSISYLVKLYKPTKNL